MGHAPSRLALGSTPSSLWSTPVSSPRIRSPDLTGSSTARRHFLIGFLLGVALCALSTTAWRRTLFASSDVGEIDGVGEMAREPSGGYARIPHGLTAYIPPDMLVAFEPGSAPVDSAGEGHYLAPHGQDAFAAATFFASAGRQRGGFFVDVGAGDGLSRSSTYHFERALGWRGLLVEANAATFSALARHRPTSLCVQAAVCHAAHDVDLVGGDALWQFLPPALRRRPPYNAAATAKEARSAADATLRCTPLGELFRLTRVAHVDLLVVDVNGAELQVLESIDWYRTTVDVVLLDGQLAAQAARAVKGDGVSRYLAQRDYMRWTRPAPPAVVEAHPSAARALNEVTFFVRRDVVARLDAAAEPRIDDGGGPLQKPTAPTIEPPAGKPAAKAHPPARHPRKRPTPPRRGPLAALIVDE